MRYITRSDIVQSRIKESSFLRENEIKQFDSGQLDRKFVFLSHSHKDRDIIESVVAYLRKVRINFYVDWMDEEMPVITDRETAERIKKKIRDCYQFIVLLTENSKDSKWVPWELGYADGPKELNEISILPIKFDNSRESVFNGVEYMKLYNTIKYDDIYKPFSNHLKIVNNSGQIITRSMLFS